MIVKTPDFTPQMSREREEGEKGNKLKIVGPSTILKRLWLKPVWMWH